MNYTDLDSGRSGKPFRSGGTVNGKLREKNNAIPDKVRDKVRDKDWEAGLLCPQVLLARMDFVVRFPLDRNGPRNILYDRMIKHGVITSRHTDASRRRILEAAGKLFAAKGYHAVGFRDMAAAAGVSLRMPHHYFGSKRRLFAECVRHALGVRINFAALFRDPTPTGDPRRAKAIIGRNVRACFFAIHPSSGRPSWSGDLIGRALTEDLDESLAALQEGLKPAREWFYPALRVLRPDMSLQAYILWYVSLWAQISFYVTARPAILARLGKKSYGREFIETAADHLVHVMLKQLEFRQEA